MYRVPAKSESTLFRHTTLDWILLAVCHTDGAVVAAACCMPLSNLHARKSCTALLLMLLCVYDVCLRLALRLWLDCRCCLLLL